MLQLGIVALIAALVTAPIVLWIPRQRQSPAFDRLLWGATALLAILGAYAAPNYFGRNSTWNNWVIAELPIVPTVTGAIVGALSVNILLWLMDRFSAPEIEAEAEIETGEDEHGASATDTN